MLTQVNEFIITIRSEFGALRPALAINLPNIPACPSSICYSAGRAHISVCLRLFIPNSLRRRRRRCFVFISFVSKTLLSVVIRFSRRRVDGVPAQPDRLQARKQPIEQHVLLTISILFHHYECNCIAGVRAVCGRGNESDFASSHRTMSMKRRKMAARIAKYRVQSIRSSISPLHYRSAKSATR